jgi:hypothetical protein
VFEWRKKEDEDQEKEKEEEGKQRERREEILEDGSSSEAHAEKKRDFFLMERKLCDLFCRLCACCCGLDLKHTHNRALHQIWHPAAHLSGEEACVKRSVRQKRVIKSVWLGKKTNGGGGTKEGEQKSLDVGVTEPWRRRQTHSGAFFNLICTNGHPPPQT